MVESFLAGEQHEEHWNTQETGYAWKNVSEGGNILTAAWKNIQSMHQ